MEHHLLEASDLVEGLRYLDDLHLINEDIVGCAATVADVLYLGTVVMPENPE